MTSLYQPPLIPGLNSGAGPVGPGSQAYTRNPFFSVSDQFLPRNLFDVIRWVRFITLHSPVTTEVMRKLSTYPITKFIIESKDPAVKSKYEQLIKSFRLKSSLHDIGFQYFTIGNVFISIYFPFIRSYACPSCTAVYRAENAGFLKFKNYEMVGVCPKCNSSVTFKRNDVKAKNISDMNLIIWDPLNISVSHNPISGKSKYYYKIPNDIRKKIMLGDRMTLDSTPWEFIEAVREQKDFEFEDNYIFHMRNVDMGLSVNGICIPPMVSHFNLVFYQATLRRANESIASDFMSPMRAIFPQPQTANSDPVVSISMKNFVAKMEEAMVKHKQDKSHVLISPVPLGYQAISGEGKTLLVNQEISQAEQSLLLSMGVSLELLSGTTNWTSSTVGLRMLKNTLDSYVGQIQEVLDWITTNVSSYLDINNVKLNLSPFQLTDDDALKNMLTSLFPTGNVSMTTLYEAMGRSYEDELERIVNDAKMKARFDVRAKFEIEQAQYLESLEINKAVEKDESYVDILKQCQEMAEQLINADPTTTRQVLNELKLTDYAKYLMVAKLLEEGRTQQTHQVVAEQNTQLAQQAGASNGSGDNGSGDDEGDGPPGVGGGGGVPQEQEDLPSPGSSGLSGLSNNSPKNSKKL